MNTAIAFPKLVEVVPLPKHKLQVKFRNGESRQYDFSPHLSRAMFQPLADESRFAQVRPDPHGYAVVWDDEMDLAASEIWLNGKTIQAP